MTTEAKIKISSSELGVLWMGYVSISARIMFYEVFKNKTIDEEARNIITGVMNEAINVKNEFVNIFNKEKVVIPLGFNENDIINDAPPLFDDILNIMYVRQLMKFNLGHNAVSTTISYMEEVTDIFKLDYDISIKYYKLTTEYLLKKGVLARPPYVTMPKQVEFVNDKSYMSGINFFTDKRSLNTTEVGYIYEAVEDNIFAMQMLTGFAQVAKESEVKKYFLEGKELTRKIVDNLSSVLSKSDIQPPSAWAGNATDSIISPFSDKMMIYKTNLMSSTSLGFTALGAAYSMRNDLPIKLGRISKDVFDYARKGSKIMIKYKWLEQPPQMEDRNSLTK